MIVIFLFWILAVYLPTIIWNTGAFVDGISNFPSIFSFSIYAIIILFYIIKRQKTKTKKINNWLFTFFSLIAVTGILLLVSYQTIYNFFIRSIIDPNWTTHWGLFLAGDPRPKIVGWQASVMFFSFITIYISFPVINYYLAKRIEKNNVCINTQK